MTKLIVGALIVARAIFRDKRRRSEVRTTTSRVEKMLIVRYPVQCAKERNLSASERLAMSGSMETNGISSTTLHAISGAIPSADAATSSGRAA